MWGKIKSLYENNLVTGRYIKKTTTIVLSLESKPSYTTYYVVKNIENNNIYIIILVRKVKQKFLEFEKERKKNNLSSYSGGGN